MSRSHRANLAVLLAKRSAGEARTDEELDHAVRRVIGRAVAPEGVTDIFVAAGLPKPDISILSDEFLAEVCGMEHPNVAVELLRKLLQEHRLVAKALIAAEPFTGSCRLVPLRLRSE